MITQFEERLSWVPRWTIVRTIQKQSVDGHSFRVALSATRIATKYGYFGSDDYKGLYEVQRLALLHDRYEAFSGDIASPSKSWFNTGGFEEHYRSRSTRVGWSSPDVLIVVKVADIYEALVFLYTDKGMGNRTLDKIIADLTSVLEARCISITMFDDLINSAKSFETEQQDSLRD